MVGKDCLCAPLLGDGPKAAVDLPDRVVPGHSLEITVALGPHPPHGVEQPIRVVQAAVESRDLAADEPLRRGVAVAGGNLGDPTLVHRYGKSAGVGTVKRANG